MTGIISGFGFVATFTASNTIPIGFVLTDFADDVDPFDVPSLQVVDGAMGLNGDLLRWTKPNPIKISFSVWATSLSDKALSTVLNANRAGKSKQSANDIITINVVYPSTSGFFTFINGAITDGMPAHAISSAGRLKSKTYSFMFENVIGA